MLSKFYFSGSPIFSENIFCAFLVIFYLYRLYFSTKFSSKLRFVKTVHELGKIVPMEYIYIPDPVQQ